MELQDATCICHCQYYLSITVLHVVGYMRYAT